MNYIDIDFNTVKGYSSLSEPAKRLFERVYKVHNSCHGIDYKAEWVPVRVKEHRKYLEVHFKNGEWLHYLPDGTWF